MLELAPLCTVHVRIGTSLPLGDGPIGARSIGAFTEATVSGARLRGTLVPGSSADWMLRSGSFGIIDVRMTIRTPTGALVLVTYGGRLDLSNPQAGYTAVVAPTFETGDAELAWLNRLQAIGKGRLSADAAGAALDYEFFEVL